MTTSDDALRKQAIARLHKKAAFWRMVGGFAGLNIFMIAIWAISGMGSFWPVWTILGGLFALVPMAWSTFGPATKGITDAQIEAEMNRLRGSDN